MQDHEWLDRSEFPFAPHYLQLAAGRMHYVDEGSGEPVVLLHGNPTWSFLYRHLIKQLRSTHRCIAPDYLGFGLSDKPADWSYKPKDHAANLTRLIETLGLDGITLVMQDWGGPIGLSYALSHPRNVSRLILINTWAWPVNHNVHYIAFSAFMGGPIGRLLIRRGNVFARVLLRQAFGDKTRLSRQAHAHYLHPLDSPKDRKGCLVFPKEILGSSAWLAELWQEISVLRDKPVLLVWGMKDIAFREKELQRWQQTFPHHRVVRLPSVGHFVPEEAPERLSEAVTRFLHEGVDE
ncbi:alpha/beta fold hydrolase [Litchfieldella rifensis]|uniref:Alpha/beta fold hydrolase n=1 Tax=Litchfieldella rifensis TaxID=762643 RepID=A0ABV7LK42_9GAMM